MGSLFRKPKVREPKKLEPTPQEQALSRRQDEALSREIEEENRRKKALLRSTLGDKSLLSGLNFAGGPTGAGGSTFTGVQFAGGAGPAGKESLLPPLSPKPPKPGRPTPPRDFR